VIRDPRKILARGAPDNVWFYLASIVSSIVIALFAPNDVLTKHSYMQAYVSIFAQFVPSIDKLAAVSSFPEVTQLVLSVMWSLIPIQIAIFFRNPGYTPNMEMIRKKRPFFIPGLAIFAACFYGIYFLFDVTTADLEKDMLNTQMLRFASTSRFGLGILAGCCGTATSLMIISASIWIRFCPGTYFTKENKES
jgi:hypothetical protein